jgi:hypothetical protein
VCLKITTISKSLRLSSYLRLVVVVKPAPCLNCPIPSDDLIELRLSTFGAPGLVVRMWLAGLVVG